MQYGQFTLTHNLKLTKKGTSMICESASPPSSYPLTSSQMEIYLDQARDPSSTAYNTGGYARFFSPLDVEAMQRAIDSVTKRHDVFHIAFAEQGDEIVQTFMPSETKTKYLDFSDFEDPQTESRKWVEEQFQLVFPLDKHGLYNTYVLKVSEEEYWLVLYAHHLILDGLSYGIWAENIFGEYFALTGGRFKEFGEPVQFYELAEKSYKYVASKSYTKSADFWQKQLERQFEPVITPSHSSGDTDTDTGTCMVSKVICPDYYQRLIDFSESIGTTIHQLFIGTLYSYFAACSGRTLIPVCLPFHNRTGTAKRAIGCFASVSPLLLEIDTSRRFSELLDDLNDGFRSISRHTKYPISKVLHQARKHQPHINHLFDINFNYYKVAFDIDTNGINLETNSLRTGQKPPFKFHLCEFRAKQDIQIQIEAQLAYFSERECTRILERVMFMIEQIVANPKIRIDEFELVSNHDQSSYKQLNLRTKEKEKLGEKTLCQLFEQYAHDKPHDTAIVFKEQSLTFDALNRKANQLANKILSLNVESGAATPKPIGLCVNRSIEMLIGLLGIMKAGAAYVPIDPKAPAERVRYISENANMDIVVSDKNGGMHLPGTISHKVLIDDSFAPDWFAQYPDSNLAVPASHSDTMYIIYTSGSTGHPKGVSVSNANVMHLQNAMVQILGEHNLQAPFKWAWNAPVYFDASVQALTLLAKGAEIYLLDDEHRTNPDFLARYLESQKIDLLDITPSLLDVLVKSAEIENVNLPNLLVGGEAISGALWHKISQHCRRSQRFALNVYGPTECTVNTTFASIDDHRAPTIGKCLPGAEVFVLNDSKQLLPYGVEGELAIGGSGVAQGYINNSALTDKHFIKHPMLGQLYLTGDLVSLLEDGNLEYKGRVDNQIKLRGYRIELEEIEEVLCSHENVNGAVVTVENEQLIAFVVSDNVSQNALQRHLQTLLPSYMQVSHIEFIPEVPITMNGKKDRKRLTAMRTESLAKQYVAPQNETQRAIQQIWHKLLEREDIGIEDNFFDIGGHSLMAIRIASACRELFEVEVKLSEFMEAPTIKELAERISHATEAKSAAAQVIHTNLNIKNSQRVIL
jgi:amino acid adenylation domain-containing protein